MTAGILAREGVLLGLLFLLGIGPAAFLPRAWGAGTRLALAPAFGLAVGAAALTTVSFFVPLRHSLWFAVLPLAALSTIIAIRRERLLSPEQFKRRELGALVLVVFWSIGVFSLPMLARQSYGPMGFGIFDAPGYGTLIFGYARNTTRHPIGVSPSDFENPRHDNRAWGEPWDLTSRYGWGFVFQHTGATTIPAALTGPTGWPAWTLITTYMAVLMTIAALGVFALSMVVFDRRVLVGCLAAVLTAGPVLLQIHVDGSLGLLAGFGLIPGILASLYWILDDGGWPAIAALGLLLAGLQNVYPELLPIVAATIGFAWLIAGKRSPFRASRRRLLWSLAMAGGLAAVLSPRTLPWSVDYLVRLGTRRLFGWDMFVGYNMRPRYVPGWLFQTRDFYTFAFANPVGRSEIWWGLAVPLIGLAVAAFGILRRRRLLVIGGMVLASALQALFARRSGCPYCVQRSLLIVAVALPVLIAGGILAVSERRRSRPLAAAALFFLLVGFANILVKTERRAVDGAYLPQRHLEPMVKAVERLPDDRAALHLEGFDSLPLWSWADVPTTYMALRETDRRLSIISAYNEYGGLNYARTRPVGHPSFAPDYGWVLTRFGALDTGREVIARHGPLALQRRTQPYDVTLARGAASDIDDPSGTPWVVPTGRHFGLDQGPLTAWVSGPAMGSAWVKVGLRGPPGTSIEAPAGSTVRTDPDGTVFACIPVPGPSPLRIVPFAVRPEPPDYIPPAAGEPPVYHPPRSVQLVTLRAYDRPCPT